MKTMWVFLWAMMLVFSCQKEAEQDLCNGDIKIKFYNASEARITNIIINDLEVGDMNPNTFTSHLCFDEFGTDTGWPDCVMSGNYMGKTLESTSKFYWCGTEKSKLLAGTYEIEISVVKWSNEEYFYLQFK